MARARDKVGEPVEDGRSDRLVIPGRSADTPGTLRSSTDEEQFHPHRRAHLAIVSVRGWSLEGTDSRKEILEKRTRNADHRGGSVSRPLPYRYRPCLCITGQTRRKIWLVTLDGRPRGRLSVLGNLSLPIHVTL